MSRPLLIIIAVVILAAAAIIGIVVGGGGSDDPAAPATPTTATDRPATAAPTAAGGVADAAALARFDAWAEPLRAAGFTITRERVVTEVGALVVQGLSIAGPPDALAWRWSSPTVRVEDAAGGGVTLRPTGTGSLTTTRAGAATTSALTATAIRLDLERDAAGRATAMTLRARGLTLQGEAGGAPLTLADGELRLTLADGGGPVPPGTTGTIRLEDLVMPGQAGGPLGTTIEALTADLAFGRGLAGWAIAAALDPWRAGETGLTLTNLQLEWGALAATGAGILTLDAAGRPAGRFAIEVADLLTVLDAFHVILRFERSLLADTYAALLEELGRNPEARTLPVTIAIANGEIVLLGESRDIADLVLGTVAPLFTPAP